MPLPAKEQVRAYLVELVALGERRGITRLASRRRVDCAAMFRHRDLLDVFDFQRTAFEMLDAQIGVYSDGALANEHAIENLVTAAPL